MDLALDLELHGAGGGVYGLSCLMGWLGEEGMVVKEERSSLEETEEDAAGIFSLYLAGATFAVTGDSIEAGDSLKAEDSVDA